MVTKWKNISEKWCGKRRNRILLWGAVLGLLVLFFGSLGFVTSGGMGLRSFSYLMDDHYLNSKRHAEEVRDAFQEVRDKCLDDTRRNISNEDWAFQGIYEFRRTGASRFNQNNIPKEAYETFIRELWKEVSAEIGSMEREAPAAVKDGIQKGEALWYFRNNTPCFYRWDGESYSAYGEDVLLSEEMLGKMSPMGSDEQITIGFTKQMIQQAEQQYSRIRTRTYVGCGGMLLGVLVALLVALFILLPDVYWNRRGRRYYDVIALAALYALCTMPDRVQDLILPDYCWTTDGTQILIELFPTVCSVAVVSGMMLFSVIHLICFGVGFWKVGHRRVGKERVFAIFNRDHSFIYRIIMGGVRKITGEVYAMEGVLECNRKRLRFTLLLSGICIFFGWFTTVIYGCSWMMWWQNALLFFCIEGVLLGGIWYVYHVGTKKIGTEYVRLIERIDQISAGNFGTQQERSEFSLFEEEFQKLSMLGCQMQINIQKQVQAEKMKLDLITNVSHDLKTPLTSLISYVDLLSKEDLPPVASDYVRVLERKSGQLRKMVVDVFDLAKASSGNLEVKQERVELDRLLVQTLADMEREIENAPVKVVTQLSESVAVLKSDGNKLYRVFQNILQNALKYSMQGTRIFVTLTVERRQAVLLVKNVAGYEMDVTAEDVMRRFFRGDKARSTEGSGLGLAIAKEFCECCGGILSVDICGDVFSVEIRFDCEDVIEM